VQSKFLKLGQVIFCLFPLFASSAYSQFGNHAAFQWMQTVELDTTLSVNPGAALRYPGIPINKFSVTQLSYYRLMEFKNWHQLSVMAKRQLESTTMLLAFSAEKIPAVFSSQLSFQFSRFLGENYAAGVQMGLLKKQFHFYRPVLIPFAQVGGWTTFSPQLKYAMTIGFSKQEVAKDWNQLPVVVLLRCITSWKLSHTFSASLQLEKLTGLPFFWQGDLLLKAGTSIVIAFAYSSNPEWWRLHFQFPAKKVNVTISIGFQPMLGTQSGLTAVF